MELIDSFNIEESDRVNRILAELKVKYPDISWQTKLHDNEDMSSNAQSSISLMVPLEQFENAKEIYKKFIKCESSIFDDLIKEVIEFRDERNWKQFHNPKDLAISLALEAGELLENFQWKSSDDALVENIDNIEDEIADVVIYAMLLSHELEINLEQAIKKKIIKNKQKYPVDKAFGSRKKYTDL